MEQLVKKLATTLLWDLISLKVEEKNQIPIMLKEVYYLEEKDNLMTQIKKCEVIDSEPLEIIDFIIDGEKILVEFEMPFILSAWSEKKQLLRITATLIGKCTLSGNTLFNWNNIDIESLGKYDWLENQKLVKILEINYTDVECEDISIL